MRPSFSAMASACSSTRPPLAVLMRNAPAHNQHTSHTCHSTYHYYIHITCIQNDSSTKEKRTSRWGKDRHGINGVWRRGLTRIICSLLQESPGLTWPHLLESKVVDEVVIVLVEIAV
jgi:hypothetical protein